ncbi:MAG: VanW family protein [Christensenellales bacterium]
MQRRQPPRRNPRAGRGRNTVKARLIRMLVVGVLLAVAVYFAQALITIGIGTPKYYNVSVNGISLKGYTKPAARTLFQSLLDDWARQEYTLTYEGHRWTFSASTIGASLDIDTPLELAWNIGHYGSLSSRVRTIREMRDEPRAFTSELTYDEEKLDAFLREIREVTDLEVINAEIVADVDAPRIVTDSRDGRALDEEKARETILSLLLTGQGEETLLVHTIMPSISSDEASGGMAVVAYYSTDISTSGSNRRKNVELSLSYYNGLAVHPGNTISFNEIVGERTERRGFLEAPEYDGTTVVNGIGGGACQASTTIYGAVIMAGMDILERHSHNMTIAYAEPSLDAAVSWPRKDLVFQNNTDHTIYIYTRVIGDKAWVVVYGNLPEHKIDFESVTVKKTIAATREEIREDVTGRYAYYTDDKYLYSQGKDGCESQGWLVYRDWDTGEEIMRKQVSADKYAPGTSIYFVGVHARQPETTVNPEANW